MAGDDKVTLRDIYDAVGRLEEKLDKRIGKSEKDIEDLKAFQNKALGITGVFAAFISVAVNTIWERVIKK